MQTPSTKPAGRRADLADVAALVLAGGKGQRLKPFTANFPKPLMPVGNRTVLEVILDRLDQHGIRRATLAVNHLAPLIRAYFREYKGFSGSLDYIYENEPLGTAGPIGNLPPQPGTLLVMNGDILTDFDFEAFVANHRACGAVLSVATMLRRFELDSGVVDVSGEGNVLQFREKPVSHHRICIGIYALEERARALVEPNRRLDMPDLIMRLVEAGETVVAYDHPGTWIDIGRPDDLARAQALFETVKIADPGVLDEPEDRP